MFEILYLDILLEAKLSYSYKCLPLSCIYHTHRYVYKAIYTYMYTCVYFMVGVTEWNTTVMEIQLSVFILLESPLVTLTEDHLAAVF